MDKLKWLQKRQKGIGGSDVGAILGVNKMENTISGIFRKNRTYNRNQ